MPPQSNPNPNPCIPNNTNDVPMTRSLATIGLPTNRLGGWSVAPLPHHHEQINMVDACLFSGNSRAAFHVQASVQRFGLIALAPMATAHVQDSLQLYDIGVRGDGVAGARLL